MPPAISTPRAHRWILSYPRARRPAQGSSTACVGLLFDLHYTSELAKVGDELILEMVSFSERRGDKLDPSVSFSVSRIDPIQPGRG
jgi:hypothetical protein